jgi:hypothetical protein
MAQMTDAERIEAEEERRRKKREADMVRYLLIKPIFHLHILVSVTSLIIFDIYSGQNI